jgi:hypothetical protein
MKWETINFGAAQCATHKWSNRALAVPLENGEAVILAECCVRCGTVRACRKAGSGAFGAGSR